MEEGGLTGWVVDVIDTIGALGVGFLILLENVFPPIPSEVILPFAGFSADRGEMNVILAWAAATAGALGGAYILYGLGRGFGYERLHELAGKRWFVVVGQRDLERGMRFFDRYGGPIVLGGRCVPLVRSVVSIPAGLHRMPLGRFSLYTAVGSGIWNAIFVGLGYYLGESWDTVEHWVQPIAYAVVAAIVVAIIWLAVRKYRRWGRGRAGRPPRAPTGDHADAGHPTTRG